MVDPFLLLHTFSKLIRILNVRTENLLSYWTLNNSDISYLMFYKIYICITKSHIYIARSHITKSVRPHTVEQEGAGSFENVRLRV